MHEIDICTLLDWDTTFFGKRIARVNSQNLTINQANEIDQWCEQNAIDCLYFLAQSDDAKTIQLAEDYRYRQVDIRVSYEQNLAQNLQVTDLPQSFEFDLDVAISDDLPILLGMASDTFIHSRFYYDKYFSYEQSNELYQIWMKRSVEDNFADRVIVFRKNDIPQGFITCNLDHPSHTGEISLIGVSAQARGKQLGTHLVQQALAYFQQENMQSVQVVTQARNVSANRLYQKCGFRTINVELWYHKWFSKTKI